MSNVEGPKSTELSTGKPASYAPIYAVIYPALAELVKSCGYALAVHGSMQRDFDLIAVPWDNPQLPQQVVKKISEQFALELIGPLELKGHGRWVQTLAFGGECFLDFGFALGAHKSLASNAANAEREQDNLLKLAHEETLILAQQLGEEITETEPLRAQLAALKEERDSLRNAVRVKDDLLKLAEADNIPFYEGPPTWRARRIHELKCWPEYFGPLASGSKPFELRLDDRGYKVGDTLFLQEWDPELGEDDPDEGYTDNGAWAQVRSVIRAGDDDALFGIKPGYCIMGLTIRREPPSNYKELMSEGED